MVIELPQFEELIEPEERIEPYRDDFDVEFAEFRADFRRSFTEYRANLHHERMQEKLSHPIMIDTFAMFGLSPPRNFPELREFSSSHRHEAPASEEQPNTADLEEETAMRWFKCYGNHVFAFHAGTCIMALILEFHTDQMTFKWTKHVTSTRKKHRQDIFS